MSCDENAPNFSYRLEDTKNLNDPQEFCATLIHKGLVAGEKSADISTVIATYHLTLTTKEGQKLVVTSDDERLWLKEDSSYVCLRRKNGDIYYQEVSIELSGE